MAISPRRFYGAAAAPAPRPWRTPEDDGWRMHLLLEPALREAAECGEEVCARLPPSGANPGLPLRCSEPRVHARARRRGPSRSHRAAGASSSSRRASPSGGGTAGCARSTGTTTRWCAAGRPAISTSTSSSTRPPTLAVTARRWCRPCATRWGRRCGCGTFVCLHAYVCMYACMHISMYAWMHLYMHVCVYVDHMLSHRGARVAGEGSPIGVEARPPYTATSVFEPRWVQVRPRD